MTFDFTKGPFPYDATTRGGHRVRVLCYDHQLAYPLVVAIHLGGHWLIFGRRADGSKVAPTFPHALDILPPEDKVAELLWNTGPSLIGRMLPWVSLTQDQRDAVLAFAKNFAKDRGV